MGSFEQVKTGVVRSAVARAAIVVVGLVAAVTLPTVVAAADGNAVANPQPSGTGAEAGTTSTPDAPSSPAASEPREPWENVGRPKRAMPMQPQELLDFLETVVHAQALDRKCDLLNRDDKAMLYLSYQWGRSIATNPNYPPWLFLTVIEYQGEYDRRLEPVKCNHPSMRRLSRQFGRFLEQAANTIRMEEVEIGGFHER